MKMLLSQLGKSGKSVRRRQSRGPAQAAQIEELETRRVLSTVSGIESLSALNAPPPGLAIDPAIYDDSSILVQFRPSVTPENLTDLLPGAEIGAPIDVLPGLREVRLGAGMKAEQALEAVRGHWSVLHAELNYAVRLEGSVVPNDPHYGSQWGLAKIDAPTAWGATTGSPGVIVAVIDTGVDHTHPDLAANIWINAGEIAGDGIDNDGNGYVDDVRGWDFANGDNDPMDDHGHGTHVAGTIAAVGNNSTGVAGVTWSTRIMPLKFMRSDGLGYVADAVSALNYAVANGATISNHSWTTSSYSTILDNTIRNAQSSGHIVVAAAGNSGADADSQPYYPAAYSADNIISVAATDSSDNLASFSNYGATSVDLGAPGVSILSTTRGGGYGYMSGTSMATPHVAGVVALVRALQPTWTYGQVIDQVLGSATPVAALSGKTVTGGRLDAGAAVASAVQTQTPRTFYVSTTGSDSGTGSESSPWATLQKAADSVQAGDTVIVRAGNYAGFDLWTDGTADKPITFKADSGVVIDRANSRTPDGINLEGADYIVIDGFQVQGVGRAGIRSVINRNVIIRNNKTDQNGWWGIFVASSDNVLIENNETSRSVKEHGIYVSSDSNYATVRGNRVWGNYVNGIHMNSGSYTLNGAVVERNVIYDNGANGGAAISADGVTDSVFRNNLLYGNLSNGIALYQSSSPDASTNNVIVNNTIVAKSDHRAAVYIVGGSTGNKVHNNILISESAYGYAVYISADSLTGFASNYNAVMDRFGTSDSGVLTLAKWRSKTGQDGNSLISTATQLFVNPAGRDYHLSSSSPATDAGTSLNAPAVDLDGQSRPSGSGYDIGADEYHPTTRRYDFGTSGSPVESGYTRVSEGTGYSTSRGYGWLSGSIVSRDRASGTYLTRDLNASADATFAVDLASGTYDVTVTLGDASYGHDQMGVYLEGLHVDTVTTSAGQFSTKTYTVSVTDGQLTLRLRDLGGSDPSFVINGLQVAVGSDVTGPKVTGATASGTLAGTIDRVTFAFSEPVQDGTFTLADAKLTGPLGTITLSAVNKLTSTQYEVVFAAQSTSGDYQLVIGPDIRDLAGNQMDQNGNKVNGENPGDTYTAKFTLQAAPSEYHFDFGTSSSPVQSGYTRISEGTGYSSSRGYGWLSGSIVSRDRASGTYLTRDLNASADATFVANVADGAYNVTVTLGDASYGHDQMGVYLEGVHVDTVTTSAGQFSTKTHVVTVADGQLTLRLRDLGGSDPSFVINALDVVASTSTLAVPTAYDFGTSGSPVESGYTRIHEGTGYSSSRGYGWFSGSIVSRDRASGTYLTRDLNASADATFVIDLPSGTYNVTVTVGDASYGHDQMGVYLEGVHVDTVTTSAGQFSKKTYSASVTDGQLTLRLRDLGGSDPSFVINALEIAAALTGSSAGEPLNPAGLDQVFSDPDSLLV